MPKHPSKSLYVYGSAAKQVAGVATLGSDFPDQPPHLTISR
ncbi:hypothetical protein [Streptomyces sp. NPDC005538]